MKKLLLGAILWSCPVVFAALPVVELKPEVKKLNLSEIDNSIAFDKVKHFVPKAVFFENNDHNKLPGIKSIQDDLVVAGPGTNIQLNATIPEGVSEVYIYDSFQTIRERKLKIRGQHALLVAKGVPVGSDIIQLTHVDSDIRKKSARISFESPEPDPDRIEPNRPAVVAKGMILHGQDGAEMLGQYSWLMISGGHDLGRKPGDVLEVEGRSQFVQTKGKILLTKVFNKVSYGVLTRSIVPIYLRDTVQ